MDKRIQEYLIKENIDAWVIKDYECNSPSLKALIGKRFLTRLVYIIIPKEGKGKIVTHFIDSTFLKGLENDFDLLIYKDWNQMKECLKTSLKGCSKVMMDISPFGLMPRVSTCDYGSVCLIKEYVSEVVSSCDLLQYLSSVVKDHAYEEEKRACHTVNKIKDEAFEFISRKFIAMEEVNEYDVQSFILKRFEEEGMVTDEPPIVSVNGNAGNPHYTPTRDIHTTIHKGDVVLIDMWAKYQKEDSVFGDITWMGYVGEEIPPFYQELFDIVKEAVQTALDFLKENIPQRDVKGYEVDRKVRDFITLKGYGEYFVHRTGHNICVDSTCHGSGVNIDDYETHDTRSIIDDISFSIEPGIYMENIGVREEINVHIRDRKVEIPTLVQKEIIKIKTE